MPEILTESFCERCGTRYTFESGAPKKTARLGKFKTTAKGLRNYVMSDDTSLDEAMAAARSDDEHEHTAQQLDAFHATFNFCMNCRQYTCGNCWNDAEGRCLTCAPHLGHEIMPAPFPETLAPADIRLDAWPETDLAPAAAEMVAAEAIAEAVEPVPEVDAAGRLDRLSAATPTPEALPNAVPAAASAEDAVPSWLAAAEAEALAAAEAQAAMEASTEAFEQVPAFDAAAIAEVVAEPAVLEPEPVEPVGALELADATPELVADATELAPEPVAEVLPEADIAAAAPVAEVEPAVAEPVAADADVELVAAAVEPEPVAAEAAAEPVVAEAEPVAAEAEPVVAEAEPIGDDRAAAASRQTSAMFAKFRPGQSIDAELEAYEATVAAEQARDDVIEPETIAAAAVASAAASDETDRSDAAPAEEPAAEHEAEADHDHKGIAAAAAVAGIAAVGGGAVDLAGEAVDAVSKRGEDETAEPEHVAAAAAAAAAEPVAEPEPVAAQAQPEPVAAEPEAVPVAAEAEVVAAESAPEPEVDAAAAAARTDVVEQPTWRIVAPDAPAPVTNGHAPGPESLPAAATAIPPTPAAPEAPPQWPATPQWPQPTVAHLAQRPTSSSPAMDALWAASARDVVSGAQDTGPVGGVQPCNNCGLSLSANARFCRRCGTRQGG